MQTEPTRTRAIIDLGRLQSNYRAIAEWAGGATVMSVVKADAYGHGAVPVCQALEAAGARYIAVASLSEAAALRRAGLTADVVVLSGLQPGQEAEAAQSGLQPMISTRQQFDHWNEAGRQLGRKLPCHVKLNTGMNRLGFDFEPSSPQAKTFEQLPALLAASSVEVVGLATHLATSATPESKQTAEQLELFSRQASAMSDAGIRPRFLHAENTAAIATRGSALLPVNLALNMVRPGLALYGYLTNPAVAPAPPVQPVLEWRASLVEIREVPAGAALGYDAAYVAPRPINVGVVAVGYGDGLSRRLSNTGALWVHGVRCPILGRVSMDLTLVDLTAVDRVAIGDEAIVIGPGTQDAWDVARGTGTIPYEVLCGISHRVARQYVRPPLTG